jgi:two-component sensor histidine kinase
MSIQYWTAADGALSLQAFHLIDEITHRVVNEFSEAIATLSLAAGGSRDIQAAAVLTSAADRLRAHLESHRALQSPLDDGLADLADYIVGMCACLSRAPLATRGVQLTVGAAEVWLGADRCWRVGLVVAELIRNAARHGLGGGPGVVRVEISESSGLVTCLVSDNGRGDAAMHLGRGRRLVRALAAELGGSVEWEFTSVGCRALLAFPAVVPIDDLIHRRISKELNLRGDTT